MGNDEQDTGTGPEGVDENADEDTADGRKTTPKPEITDEHREKAKEMAKAYEDDRPTVALPGTGNTVTGQAVANWIDDDGNPKFGDLDEDGGVSRDEVVAKSDGDEGDESSDAESAGKVSKE